MKIRGLIGKFDQNMPIPKYLLSLDQILQLGGETFIEKILSTGIVVCVRIS